MTSPKKSRSPGQIEFSINQKKQKKDRLSGELEKFTASGKKEPAKRRRDAIKEINAELKDLRVELKEARAARKK